MKTYEFLENITVGLGDLNELTDVSLDIYTACCFLEAKGLVLGENFQLGTAVRLLESLEKEAA